MAIGDIFSLLFGSAAAVVGSALIWNANKNADYVLVSGQYVEPSSEIRSSMQYETLVFCFAAAAAWLHFLTSEKDANGRVIWRYLYYGFLFFAAVISNHSWQNMDFNRHFFDSDAGMFMDEDANKRLFGGEVIAYGGLFILGWSLNGPFKLRSFCTTLFFLAAVAFNVVGSVILWKLDNTQIDENSSDRDTVFQIAVSQWVTLFILAGGVLHENIDGAVASVLGLGIYGIWTLASAFLLKINNDDSQGDKAWAGSLFCWFSAWAALIAARWAVANHDGKIAA